MEFESGNIIITNPGSYGVLVNKKRSLPSDYAPEDLATIEVPTTNDNPEANMLRAYASDALTKLFDQAHIAGYELYAVSGYRSYNRQVNLFKSYAEEHGETEANRFSAKPGQSEHQTGLTMDVSSESMDYELEEEFGETPEGIWIAENAHKFGFIIRYPKGKEYITGYQYEPWHLRYLGIELAKKVYGSKLTYDEYWERFIK